MGELLLLEAPKSAVYAENADRVRSYLECTRARNTIRRYRSNFQQFQKWCEAAGLMSMPAPPEKNRSKMMLQRRRLQPASLRESGRRTKRRLALPVKDNVLIAETMKG